MALTLRELLEKQRADREAKERTNALPSNPVGVGTSPLNRGDARGAAEIGRSTVDGKIVEPAVTVPPTQTQVKRSLFARVSGTGNGASQPTNIAVTAMSPSGQPAAIVPAARQDSAQPAGLPTPLPSLPAYSEDETENFRKNLAFLAANLDEKEVIGQILRTTVRQLQQHPELSAITIDSDFDLIIEAARRSMKFVARKKEEKVDAKAKKQSQKEELTEWLKDQGIEL